MSLFSHQSAYAQAPAFPRHIVTAILVAHDGARWLPRTLTGLLGQERPVQRVVAVDTGSTDASAGLLEDALGRDSVLHTERRTAFGAAVSEALRAAPHLDPASLPYRTDTYDVSDPYGDTDEDRPPRSTEPVEWLWLLHDDSEPAPDALHLLLRAADELPSVAVLGPKVRSWYDRRQLLEVGTTLTGSGRRWTGLERREQDQGQHDAIRGVLSVSSAGLLVRRDVWESLGGFDPRLPLSRDDTDFGWRVNAAGHRVVVVPDAVIQHAEAATRERRPIDVAANRPHRVDRAGAAFTLLANTTGAGWPLLWFRLLFGGLFRSLGYLLGKLPGMALDELLGTVSVLFRPAGFLSARRARARTRTMSDKDLGDLFPSRAATVRHAAEGLIGNLRRSEEPENRSGRHSSAESGPVDEDAESLDTENFVKLRMLMRRPGLSLAVALTLITLFAARDLLSGGSLFGGALLPAPEGASDLWDRYADTWQGVGFGEAASAPPYVGALAAFATLLFGKAGTAVAVLLIGSVPLAGMSAYLCSRRLVSAPGVRVWGASAYALTPVATGAIAAGRIGTAVALVLAPVVARGAAQVLGAGDLKASMRAAWATGLVLAVVAAFTPLLWLATALLALIAVGAGFAGLLGPRPGIGLLLRVGVVLGTPLVLLGPWTLALAGKPALFLSEPGLAGDALADKGTSPVGLLLLDPGGPGTLPIWLTGALLVAALAALLRDSRRAAVLGAWAVALVGLLLAVVVSHAEITVEATGAKVPAWPGAAVVVIALGYVMAAMVGAEDARTRVAAGSFGWRQPTAVVLAVVAGAAPFLAAGTWLWKGADGPLERRDPVVVPAFVAEEATGARHPRTLVLTSPEPGNVSYTIVRGAGPALGDAEMAPKASTYRQFNTFLGKLIAGGGGADASMLAPYGIEFIQLKPPVGSELTARLDGTPGLARVGATQGATLWRLQYPVGRALIVDPDGKAKALPTTREGVSTRIEAGPQGRILRLAERADSGWQATQGGRKLTARTLDGWAQGFELRPEAGRLELTHSSGGHGIWLLVQGVLVFVVFVMALPARRRGTDDDLPEAAATPVAAGGAGEGGGRRGRRKAEPAEPAEPVEAPEAVPVAVAADGLDAYGFPEFPEQRTDPAEAPVPVEAWQGTPYDGTATPAYEQYPQQDYGQQYQGYPDYQGYQYDQQAQGMPAQGAPDGSDAAGSFGWTGQPHQSHQQPAYDEYGNPLPPQQYDPTAYQDPAAGRPPEPRSGDDPWPPSPQGDRP
ncbi:glycosyltransferase [Embleya sp. NPDC059237]|uniref:glycosyltransferase family 2 protein n=1 Tax=Embleya sp. NPDC059237 TaxID=3346784 RepID=UPI0036A3EFA5